jgi:ribosomal protein L11 methyltransferase
VTAYCWFEILVSTSGAQSSAISALLFELGAQGIEERSFAGGQQLVTCCESEQEASRMMDGLRAAGLGGHASLRAHAGRDWATAYVDHLRPEPLGCGFLLVPAGVDVEDADGRRLVHFEPGHAFGVGSHPTTQLAAAALERRLMSALPAALLDVGTGTGVLALVAASLGVGRVLGVDVSEESVALAARSARLNGIDEGLEFRLGSAADVEEHFGMVVANIEYSTWQQISGDVIGRMAPGAILLATGVVEECRADIEATWFASGLSVIRWESLDGWCLWELQAPAAAD